MTRPITRTGIGVFATDEFAMDQAKRLFLMALADDSTDEELRQLVTRDSLFELIVYVSDFQKSLRARINQEKSKRKASKAKADARELLHHWLDANIEKYKGQLDKCAEDASSIPGLGRGFSWNRREITQYLKGNRFARC